MLFVRRLRWLAAGLACVHASVTAAIAPATGYATRPLTQTSGALLEGLDLAGNSALLGAGTQVRSFDLDTFATNSIGTLPANVTVAFVKQRDATVHAAIGTSFNFPFPVTHGAFNAGTFTAFGSLDGIYDAAVDASNTLYLVANPSAAGSRVYRYVPATTTLVEVINAGGFSGGIAFDSQSRLYVAEQNTGTILRYTPAQLAAGNLTAAHGEPVVSIFASYLCLDAFDRLYVVSGFGNRLTLHDSTTGSLLREIAVDGLNGFGIGRIAWDAARGQLLAVHSDYGLFGSTLEAITFAPSDAGLSGTSSVFKGWAAAVHAFVRPNPYSGGYALDNNGTNSGVAGAVLGAPLEFDPEVFPLGHILSLGNGGSITLSFDAPIYDGPGPDFAVFENGFDFGDLTFSEFAFVEVATRTNAWARFPVTFLDTNAPGIFKVTDATRVDGLAGKHTLAYGTPFDLAWLARDTNVLSGAVDLQQIAYVRITDVIGDGSTTDALGHPIRDPHNPDGVAATDGFELRGVGVIHLGGDTAVPASVPEASPVYAWFGYPGRTYQLQRGNGVTWTDHGAPIAGTGGVMRIDMPVDQPASLFRMIQQIPVGP